MLTYLKIAAVAVLIIALPQSARAQDLGSIPVFAQLATEPDLHSYVAPVDVVATIHKFMFRFVVRRHGVARFDSPGTLTVALESVPPRYTSIFGELGDVQSWSAIYDLEPLDGDTVRGVPRAVSDVDDVLIRSTDVDSPIAATWSLHSGWTISATIETELVEQHLLPKHEIADISGHGVKIHADLRFGDYMLNEGIPATVGDAK